jgi:hypothetical protein
LEIVGITFELAADTSSSTLRQFYAEALELAQQSLRLTKILGPDLRRSLLEDTDFSDSVAELDILADRAQTFKNHVHEERLSEPDPEVVQLLMDLCRKIEDLQAKIEQLRRLIAQI